jgi:predicted MFS family arabinose efflux permease
MKLLGWILLFGSASGATIVTALLLWRVVEARRERREARELRVLARRYE